MVGVLLVESGEELKSAKIRIDFPLEGLASGDVFKAEKSFRRRRRRSLLI